MINATIVPRPPRSSHKHASCMCAWVVSRKVNMLHAGVMTVMSKGVSKSPNIVAPIRYSTVCTTQVLHSYMGGVM
jgi:hypothetical protein